MYKYMVWCENSHNILQYKSEQILDLYRLVIDPLFTGDDGLGKVSNSFTKSAMRIAQSINQFEKIERATKEFSKTSTWLLDSLTATDGQQDLVDDGRVNLEGDNSNENEDNLD